jgi:hypothetical protein
MHIPYTERRAQVYRAPTLFIYQCAVQSSVRCRTPNYDRSSIGPPNRTVLARWISRISTAPEMSRALNGSPKSVDLLTAVRQPGNLRPWPTSITIRSAICYGPSEHRRSPAWLMNGTDRVRSPASSGPWPQPARLCHSAGWRPSEASRHFPTRFARRHRPTCSHLPPRRSHLASPPASLSSSRCAYRGLHLVLDIGYRWQNRLYAFNWRVLLQTIWATPTTIAIAP